MKMVEVQKRSNWCDPNIPYKISPIQAKFFPEIEIMTIDIKEIDNIR